MANTTITPSSGSITLSGVATAALILTLTPTVGPWEVQYQQTTVQWQATPELYVGGPTPLTSYRNASFQATGTWGTGGSVQIEGSNDGVNWFKLSPAALTSAGLFAALGASERPKFFRPNVTAGDATTSITIVGWLS